MTDHELRQELEQTYELVCFANLADIGARHSEVYQLFSQHCQEEYQPNQRLIFYSSEEPSQKLLDHIQKVRIQISIDDVGPRFEIQRGGVWEAIDANVRKYVALIQPERFEVILNPTVNIQNILYLDELFDYAKELNVGVGWQFLRQPESLNIDCMTPAAVRLVKSKFAQSPYESLRDLAAGLVEDPTHTGKNFVEYMNKLDSIRAQNFAQSHPEIFQAMSQVP